MKDQGISMVVEEDEDEINEEDVDDMDEINEEDVDDVDDENQRNYQRPD